MDMFAVNPSGQTFMNFGAVGKVGATPPTDTQRLLEKAEAVYSDFNAGMAVGDTRAALLARSDIKKLAKEVEQTLSVDDGSAWLTAEMMCEDGVEPTWGRAGRFVIHAHNCWMDVSYGGLFARTVTVRPVYWTNPFVAPNGMRQYSIERLHDRAWDTSLVEAITNTIEIQHLRSRTALVPLLGPLRDGEPDIKALGPYTGDPAWSDGGFLDRVTEGRFRAMRQTF